MVWYYENMGDHIPDLKILRRCWPEHRDVRTTHIVDVHGVKIGGPDPVVIGGPCSVESRKQTLNIAHAVKKAGAKLLRGGVFKPRSNPYSFQGLGEDGLKILEEARAETGLGIITEVMDPRRVEKVAAVADMLQIGTRSMYNYPLLTEAGRAGKPVLLKRAWCATIEEWLCSAEYIAKEGNLQVVFCERGIRTPNHWNYARGILDLNIIEPVRQLTPLPVIVDPSHATGMWTLVPSMSRAALATGVHGLLIEVMGPGVKRSDLKCDARQAIEADTFAEIVGWAKEIQVPEILQGVDGVKRSTSGPRPTSH